MKRIIYYLYVVFIFFLGETKAQDGVNKEIDNHSISIKALVWSEDIPLEACHNLETKLQQILIRNGFADNDYIKRFVLVAKISVLVKDILPSTPVRILQKLEITFMLGDVIENKLYGSTTITLSGIGTNETKSFISAFSKINPQREEFQAFFNKSKEKIISFYTEHCDEILYRANTLANMQKYNESISLLLSMPNICSNCYDKCQKGAIEVYKRKIDEEGHILLNKAENEWAKESNATGAHKVLTLISQINPHSTAYIEMKKLRSKISRKLRADEKKEWEFQMQKYQDDQAFKHSIVDAVRNIGVAWGNGQPQNVTKTIVRSWW